MSSRLRPFLVVLTTAVLAGCGASSEPPDWPTANGDLGATRSHPGDGIDVRTVGSLVPAWRFTIPSTAPDESGTITATPVVADGVVYVQDMRSNVYALEEETGQVVWTRRFDVASPGPNGVAVADDTVFGVTDHSVFALAAGNGRRLWEHDLINGNEHYVDIAPQVADGRVFVSTIAYRPNGKGALYAFDAKSGKRVWRFTTIARPWPHPLAAGGGGAWYPPSVADGVVYWGTANPVPWGGTPKYPNGAAYPGDVLYTDSLLAVDAETGRLRWYDQVTPHDIRDYDFHLSPVLGDAGDEPAVFGAGKAGVVVAWSRQRHTRIWQARVGLHRNDVGPLPNAPVDVCPGLLGGAETPMAYDGERLYVTVVDLCSRGSAVGYAPLADLDVTKGTGRLVALDASTGATRWQRSLASASFGCATVIEDVVVTSTFDGVLYGFDAHNGRRVWRARAPYGVNACPAVSRGRLIFAAGLSSKGSTGAVVAYEPAATGRRR